MIVTLAFDTALFADDQFRSLVERFFQSEITHTEVATQLKEKPEQVSAMLGAIFIIALRDENAPTRINIFPELTVKRLLDIELAQLMAAGLEATMAAELLTMLIEDFSESN